jgi:hypothetical protein
MSPGFVLLDLHLKRLRSSAEFFHRYYSEHLSITDKFVNVPHDSEVVQRLTHHVMEDESLRKRVSGLSELLA